MSQGRLPLGQSTSIVGGTNIQVDRLSSDLLNLAVIVVFVILFLRTAAPSVDSRYLKHLAGVYALIGFSTSAPSP